MCTDRLFFLEFPMCSTRGYHFIEHVHKALVGKECYEILPFLEQAFKKTHIKTRLAKALLRLCTMLNDVLFAL